MCFMHVQNCWCKRVFMRASMCVESYEPVCVHFGDWTFARSFALMIRCRMESCGLQGTLTCHCMNTYRRYDLTTQMIQGTLIEHPHAIKTCYTSHSHQPGQFLHTPEMIRICTIPPYPHLKEPFACRLHARWGSLAHLHTL